VVCRKLLWPTLIGLFSFMFMLALLHLNGDYRYPIFIVSKRCNLVNVSNLPMCLEIPNRRCRFVALIFSLRFFVMHFKIMHQSYFSK
jgi:hypothetical protein